MKKKEWQEILKKCFGKEKDSRYHAIAMLSIYGIFILLLIIMIRTSGGNSSMLEPANSPSPSPTTPSVVETPTKDPVTIPDSSPDLNDINYSYSYTISYNGKSEVYLGKKIDEKEKFTLIKNGEMTDYAILNDNYLILENGIYHITESPSLFFKYCDIDRIFSLIEEETPIEKDNNFEYIIPNKNLSSVYLDVMLLDNEENNKIQLSLTDGVLKKVDLDFSNYLTSVEGGPVNFTIHMEFVDVGTTEDFEVKVF